MNVPELEKGELKFPYYRGKGDCSTCKRRPPGGDCTEKKMFFICCSSEYNGDDKIHRAIRTNTLFPDWYEPKEERS